MGWRDAAVLLLCAVVFGISSGATRAVIAEVRTRETVCVQSTDDPERYVCVTTG